MTKQISHANTTIYWNDTSEPHKNDHNAREVSLVTYKIMAATEVW